MHERKAVAHLSQAIEDAYSAFVAEHGDRAVRLAYVTLRHRTDAEDVAQEAFYRLWRHCLRRGPQTLSHALLYQTVMNLCRDRMRYHRRHPEDAVDPQDIVQAGPGGPDRDQAMAISQAVQALKPGEQELDNQQRKQIHRTRNVKDRCVVVVRVIEPAAGGGLSDYGPDRSRQSA